MNKKIIVSFCVVVVILGMLFLLSIAPSANATTNTLYLRSSDGAQTVNGLTAYGLLPFQSGVNEGTGVTDTTAQNTFEVGIRVWALHAGGSETEITSGTPVATEMATCDPEDGGVTVSGTTSQALISNMPYGSPL